MLHIVELGVELLEDAEAAAVVAVGYDGTTQNLDGLNLEEQRFVDFLKEISDVLYKFSKFNELESQTEREDETDSSTPKYESKNKFDGIRKKLQEIEFIPSPTDENNLQNELLQPKM